MRYKVTSDPDVTSPGEYFDNKDDAMGGAYDLVVHDRKDAYIFTLAANGPDTWSLITTAKESWSGLVEWDLHPSRGYK